MIKWDLSQGCKHFSISTIKCDTQNQRTEESKPYDHLNTNKPIYKTDTASQTNRTNLWWGEGIVREFEINMYTLLP